jgi:hypothetical protein
MRGRNALIALAILACVAATGGTADAENSVEVWHGQRLEKTEWRNTSGRRGDVEVRTTVDRNTRDIYEKVVPPSDEEATDEAAGDEAATDEAAADETAPGTTKTAKGKVAKRDDGSATDGETAAANGHADIDPATEGRD